MKVWLVLDPETSRVSMLDREPEEHATPGGPRGEDWPVREAELPEGAWRRLLAGELDPDAQDALHRGLWTQNGDAPWPSR